MTLLTVVIFGSPSITTFFTTGLVSNLYSVITWPPSITTVSDFFSASITLISGPRTKRQRFKKDYLISDFIHLDCASATRTKESPGYVLHHVLWQSLHTRNSMFHRTMKTKSNIITQISINSQRSPYSDVRLKPSLYLQKPLTQLMFCSLLRTTLSITGYNFYLKNYLLIISYLFRLVLRIHNYRC